MKVISYIMKRARSVLVGVKIDMETIWLSLAMAGLVVGVAASLGYLTLLLGSVYISLQSG
jgi:hypothetical protein